MVSCLNDMASPVSMLHSLPVTTRNRDLDDWARGHCLGSDSVDKEIAKRQLQYGLLVVDGNSDEYEKSGGIRQAAFGFQGTVIRLKKGDKYV
jgi:hypothetical protein